MQPHTVLYAGQHGMSTKLVALGEFAFTRQRPMLLGGLCAQHAEAAAEAAQADIVLLLLLKCCGPVLQQLLLSAVNMHSSRCC